MGPWVVSGIKGVGLPNSGPILRGPCNYPFIISEMFDSLVSESFLEIVQAPAQGSPTYENSSRLRQCFPLPPHPLPVSQYDSRRCMQRQSQRFSWLARCSRTNAECYNARPQAPNLMRRHVIFFRRGCLGVYVRERGFKSHKRFRFTTWYPGTPRALSVAIA